MARGGFPGGFGGLDMNKIMKEAKKIQSEMEKTQTDLANKEFESTTGGGAVYIRVDGTKNVKQIKIEKDVVDPDDVEMLEDMILTCLNDVFSKVDRATSQEMGKFNIPGF